MALTMGVRVVPEQPRRVIARNLHRVVQTLARHRNHSEHIILRSVRRYAKPMKMQIRHVHAGIYRTGFRRRRGQLVNISDSESVTRKSTDDRSYSFSLVSEGVPAIFIHGT